MDKEFRYIDIESVFEAYKGMLSETNAPTAQLQMESSIVANIYNLALKVSQIEHQLPYNVRADKTEDFRVSLNAHLGYIRRLEATVEAQASEIKELRGVDAILQGQVSTFDKSRQIHINMIKHLAAMCEVLGVRVTQLEEERKVTQNKTEESETSIKRLEQAVWILIQKVEQLENKLNIELPKPVGINHEI